jgi:hypothetical protein
MTNLQSFEEKIIKASSLRLYSAGYLTVIYIFGVFNYGAWSDDFPSLSDPYGHFVHATRDGRPLYGFAIKFFFETFTTVDSLKFVRLFGLVGLILLSDAVLKYLLSKDSSMKVAVASSVAFSLPSFQFSAHWAVAFGMSWTGFLAVVGLFLWERDSIKFKILGSLLFSLSFLIYPLMSFFIFSVIFVSWFLNKTSLTLLLIRLRNVFLLLALGFLISFTSSRIILSILGLSYNPRVDLISIADLPSKTLWFVSRPFILSFRPFFIDSPSITIVAVQFAFSFFFLLLLLHFLHLSKVGILKFFLLLSAFIALGLLPLIIATQNQIDVRFLSSNTWLISFIFICATWKVIENNLETRTRILPAVSLLSVVVLFFGAYSVNDKYLNVILPIQNSTKIFVLKELANCRDSQILAGVVIVDRTAPWPSRKYLGVFSQTTDLASSWVPPGAIASYFSELTNTSVPLKSIKWGSPSDSHCVVDLNRYVDSN